jgi:uncharacterized membrane protein YgdD (TMEM256/DUF423 family)
MEILYPAGVLAAILVCLSVFGAHALRMRTEKNYREAWGSATLALLPAAIFWLWVASGEPEMIKRTALLIPIGALVGACLFAYAGYVIGDVRVARAQNSMATGSRESLAVALEELATVIANAPAAIIGSQTTVTAGPGSSGTIIGKQVTVTAGPGSTGSIIGEQTNVNSSGTPVNGQRSAVLRDAAGTGTVWVGVKV